MFVASCKVLVLLPPVKMGGREMENGEGVAYGKHSERYVCVRVWVEGTGEGRRRGAVKNRQTPVLVDNGQSAH